MTTSPSDRQRVEELLGREPRGRYEIVVRDDVGDPLVLRNEPFLDDGTPMPTTYWLVGPVESQRIGRLESEGGVDAAEAAIPPEQLAASHARYAAERDAAIPDAHEGPRPSGGVGGTRVGVKCLHAHWAWHLAGGDDPVGHWIARKLALTVVSIHDDHTEVQLGPADPVDMPWGAVNLSRRWLTDGDPPRPEALTNALGSVADHLDDLIRDHPQLGDATALSFRGPTVTSLAQLELGSDVVDEPVDLERDAAEEIFRIVATESARQRAHNPGLPSEHVDLIIATCCIVLAFMRRLHLDRVELAPGAQGGAVG